MTADIFIQKMMEHFNVFTLNELADKIGISQQAISGWKKKNAILAIKKRCRELGIYNDIFGDIANQNIQLVNSNTGNNTQGGNNIVTASTQHDDEIEPAVFEVFKRAYKKASVNEDKLDEFISYLLQFK
jgi:transcriptional regulator with XRE-family HTH domain